ncbi:tRNA 5-methoxyuridine(34)/uridine 5-oxyacetic acid(34) synthase CmoB [Chromatocurvus halotolerans]|uniref:tRNA U34 carboxymethyltransferase n=1 Tax=Chromatocurvus halotolerans TaxID=1132028 RepID=A0A4R2KI56_9GAMM|nr:tRNA 5-methoxyuridine(34)/uridine 5-oxyacetic acid(34) synthase CmoB [Chromatocurvus halotolerans]TCO70219.1 tRNA (mo5U34)-methyltransferase [Chromatocurvus halotolerans]
MSLSSLVNAWRDTPLAPWAERLPAQVERGLSPQRYGDLPRWQAALGSLPAIAVDRVNLDRPAVGATAAQPVSDALRASLQAALQGLHPWRKGPFDLFGVYIDAEWRSDWKWDRIAGEIAPLAGRRVLDVGCGSGYHGWRMLGAGAAEVIGIDPTPLFVLQFRAIQHYLQQPGIHVLPLAMQDVPPGLRAFDTVFSMGILYHRRSPLDHLLDLRDSLRAGGELVLETLVIEGGEGATLVPSGRYARMGNVWFLPSPATLLGWLRKLKFREPRLVDVSVTSTDEQRGTEWMRFHSLADFLDPADRSRTIEGYPAPRRAVVIAKAP